MTSPGPEQEPPGHEETTDTAPEGPPTGSAAKGRGFVRGDDRLKELLARPGMAQAVAALQTEPLVNPADVLTDNLRAQAQALFDAVGATDVAIFGSVAEGTSQPSSDLDLIAKFPPAFNLFNLIDLTEALGAC
ncbi:nucleotidyltransferase family protein [Nocardioides rubriscoriae]|uniref:nucleotidyltransferase family protein n=1 Tax=Nocardioides rubriscoriae TaxID=642762 RepID=UPI0011DF3669|nr:nucleotidyltransferase domain-containing protein [Nocardioides rubriscoriae]